MSTLIIHRKMTCCLSSVKQSQIKMKIGRVIKINTTGSNMTFIFNIDKVHINVDIMLILITVPIVTFSELV